MHHSPKEAYSTSRIPLMILASQVPVLFSRPQYIVVYPLFFVSESQYVIIITASTCIVQENIFTGALNEIISSRKKKDTFSKLKMCLFFLFIKYPIPIKLKPQAFLPVALCI
jgi:hypothetical protein